MAGNKKLTYLILHNIRSAHNVGSMFRTADGAGISKVFLTGYTPTPVDRFGRPQKEIAKTALGAEKHIPWEKYKHLSSLIARLKKEGVSIVALEQAPHAKNYKNITFKYPLALLGGNETRGISAKTLEKCDEVIEIPMHGAKESLNVSVAVGVALFQIIDT